MEGYSNFIIKHRKSIILSFILLAAVSILMIFGVEINYKLTEYLPPSAQSTTAVEIMAEEFTQAVPNASVMAKDVSIPRALEIKEELQTIEGIEDIIWLDSMADLKAPLELQDQSMVEGFYKNGNALYSVSITEGLETQAINGIHQLLGENGAVSGEAAETSATQAATSGEVAGAVIIIVPFLLLILVLSTGSWVEPLLFIAAIGTSIIINMGTNIFFGQISYITNSVSPILQLAVSLDYAIFLLHSFADYRKEYDDPELSMKFAIQKSVKAVAASALTTLFGFLALTFMDFGIGADLGLTLAKGIVISFICCMLLLPAITLASHKAIAKTQHREFLPSFKNINSFFSKLALPTLIIVLILTLPAFLGQQQVVFSYGNPDSPKSQFYKDAMAIEDEFGKATVMAVLVPKGDVVKEYQLAQELETLDHVTGVMSFASTVGTGIPAEFLDESITSQFYSENYARIILYTDTESEGDVAFATVEDIDDTISRHYDEFYTAGQSSNLYDMKTVVASDNLLVNMVAIIAIFLVLLFTFKSAVLPVLLLFTIEIGIWINLSIPYFSGLPLNFLGYLVISTVQLGATVDYAILLTSYYLDNRKLMPQKQSIDKAMGDTFKSILMSAAVLTMAGAALNITSSNPIVAELGLLLARGTIFSLLMVLCLLPILLKIFDKPISKLTLKAGFYKDELPKPAIDKSEEKT